MANNKSKNSVDIATLLRKASRELHKGMKPGGPQGTKKGKKGYSRKNKHNGGKYDDA